MEKTKLEEGAVSIDQYTLFDHLKIDRKINSTKSFLVLLFYRVSHSLYQKNSIILLRFMLLIKNILFTILSINTQIFYQAQIGHHIRLPHSAMGVVISHYAMIGNYVTIFHQVTLGVNENKPQNLQKIIIEDNCYLSAGCKIISCRIGNGSRVAPNAVVYKDIPEQSLCYSVNQIRSLSPHQS